MTQVLSNVHVVEIVAAPTTAIELAFAALAPGAFDQRNVPSMNASLINNGSADSIMSWARRGHWDPASPARAYFYGCTHNNSNPAQNYNYMIRYEADNDTWFKETINSPEPFTSSGIHGYYHFTERPSDGRQFLRARGSSTIYSRVRGGAWETTTVPPLLGTLFVEWNVGDALEWYPDFGPAGALVFASQTAVYTWEPGGSWVKRGTFAGTAGNDDWICYNRADSRMYFGGGTGFYTTMRRLDPDGTVVTRANTPFNCGSTPDDGSGTIFVGPVISSALGNRMFAINPSTRAIVEYNHATDGWSGTIATLPFTASQQMYFHVTIPNVGVFFHYLSGNPNASPAMHLWRR